MKKLGLLAVLVIIAFAVVSVVVFGAGSEAIGEDGKALYQANNCAMCHGGDGKGIPMMAQMFKADPSNMDLTRGKSEVELLKVLKSGRGAMPPYGDKLGDADLKALVRYIRSLK